MKIDLIEIANGAPIPDMRAVVQELAKVVVNMESDHRRELKEVEVKAFRGDASLASLLADHSVAALKKAGYTTVSQVKELNDDELLAIPNVGVKTVKEIRGL